MEVSAPRCPALTFTRAEPFGTNVYDTRLMAYAIIKTGGKQYKVAVGDKINIEKLELAEGDTATFDQVLACGEGSSVRLGTPTVDGASVTATVVKQFKADKVIIFHFKRRKGQHKRKGHRQPLTQVEIKSINA